MNNSTDSRHHPSRIREEFQLAYIDQVWKELQVRFGFPIKQWKKRFETYHKNSRITFVADAFYTFGSEKINPILNELLCRPKYYPTFQNLCQYVMQKGGW